MPSLSPLLHRARDHCRRRGCGRIGGRGPFDRHRGGGPSLPRSCSRFYRGLAGQPFALSARYRRSYYSARSTARERTGSVRRGPIIGTFQAPHSPPGQSRVRNDPRFTSSGRVSTVALSSELRSRFTNRNLVPREVPGALVIAEHAPGIVKFGVGRTRLRRSPGEGNIKPFRRRTVESAARTGRGPRAPTR